MEDKMFGKQDWVKKFKTRGGVEVERYEFKSYNDLEDFFIDHIDKFQKEGYKTKIIGLVLLKFRKKSLYQSK